MKNQVYDRERARKLVPLLTSITSELTERMRAAGALARQISALDETNDATIRDLRADLASHRREIRLVKRELETLGCIIDDENPTAVYIPGTDTEHGFRWNPGDPTVRRVQPGAAMDPSVQ